MGGKRGGGRGQRVVSGIRKCQGGWRQLMRPAYVNWGFYQGDLLTEEIGDPPTYITIGLTWKVLRGAVNGMLTARDKDCLEWLQGIFQKHWTNQKHPDPLAKAQLDIDIFAKYLGVFCIPTLSRRLTFLPSRTHPNKRHQLTAPHGLPSQKLISSVTT